MLISATDLSPGERLEVWRRRNGLTQLEAAARCGLSHNAYKRFERGEAPGMPEPLAISLGRLSAGEQCRILRRREGLTLEEVQELSGFHRKWVHRIETGQRNPATTAALVGFWTAYLRGRGR